MSIRTLPTTLRQIFCKTNLDFKVIAKTIIDPDNNFRWHSYVFLSYGVTWIFRVGWGRISSTPPPPLPTRVLARILKMPVQNTDIQISALPELATNLLQILIPTTFYCLLCQKGQFTLQPCPRGSLVWKMLIFFHRNFACPKWRFSGNYLSKRRAGGLLAKSLPLTQTFKSGKALTWKSGNISTCLIDISAEQSHFFVTRLRSLHFPEALCPSASFPKQKYIISTSSYIKSFNNTIQKDNK